MQYFITKLIYLTKQHSILHYSILREFNEITKDLLNDPELLNEKLLIVIFSNNRQ